MNSAELSMMCPICLETMKPPILQCKVGHSMCGSCIKEIGIVMCPTCRESLTTTRNYQLEHVIMDLKDILKFTCVHASKGCKFVVNSKDKSAHESECKYRIFQCEGKFANLQCNWSGEYSDIYPHFQNCHKNKTTMEYKTDSSLKINLNMDFKDIQIISFFNGKHFFYYKHKVNPSKEKVYWHFQLIGLSSQAQNFYYEFEVHNGLKKFKITEFCTSDSTNINDIFKEEKCVVMSFKMVKNYLNAQGELQFKFRLMSNNKAAKQ